jgi:hypothetical protein
VQQGPTHAGTQLAGGYGRVRASAFTAKILLSRTEHGQVKT